ncbi:MAG: AI-2E family transporter [Gammaproteobacteria bacterium]|jgi:predicted PurR-regulated permease PerM|nr:AI-2E family transporter [Gammaproteobacteria bacterium]MBU0771640.1 AI-2E family transporter [Gammaproteobacteria bacterium]MBU0856913.1 AI-2E family transporter [Gammaproteobacteria bacterium]MBU1848214.1 AI-2E family transporter [Gammaproteobacteria bacterium]
MQEHPENESSVPPDLPLAVTAPWLRNASLAIMGMFWLSALGVTYFARALLLPIVLAALFTLLLAPLVGMLKRLRVREPIGAAIIVALLLAGIGSAVYNLTNPALDWLDKSPRALREVEAKLLALKKPVDEVRQATEKVEAIAAGGKSGGSRSVVLKEPGLGSVLFAGTQYFLIGTVSTVVLMYFLLASGDGFLRKLVRLMPTMRDKIRAIGVARQIQQEIGRYFLTLSAINVGLGIATGCAMALLDMPNPALWGVMAGLLNFIPYLGPTLCGVALALAALINFDTAAEAWRIPASFLAITVIEGQFVQPMLAGRTLSLNPVAVFVSFLFWGWLWGIAGMLIAVPTLIVMKVVCSHVDGWGAFGAFLDRS